MVRTAKAVSSGSQETAKSSGLAQETAASNGSSPSIEAPQDHPIICSTTAAIVMVTVFFNGSMTTWMVEYLGIKHGVEGRSRDGTQSSGAQNEVDDLHLPGTPLTPCGSNPWDKAFLPRKWYNFDA
ncbi:hypothetical protein OSTOST_01104, partial [Ostertagia ostertagi]